MAVILKNTPKTEGRKLNFSKEEEEKYRIVFRYDAKTMNCVAQAICRTKDDWWKSE